MSYSEISSLATGLLQFGAACYLLRLAQLFSARRTGWFLFSALSILALAGGLLPAFTFISGAEMKTAIEQSIQALSALLLLVAPMHFVTLFKNHLRAESKARLAEFEWEAEVERERKQLIKTNEELRQTLALLETDMAESRKAREHAEMTCRETQERQTEMAKANEELRQSAVKSQIDYAEQKQLVARIEAAHYAERTRLVDSLLQQMMTLRQIAAQRAQHRKPPFFRAVGRLKTPAARAVTPGAHRPRGKKLPSSLARLAASLTEEQSRLIDEIDSFEKKLGQIKQTGIVPENPETADGGAVESVPQSAVSAESCTSQTETATQISESNASDNPAAESLDREPDTEVSSSKDVTS